MGSRQPPEKGADSNSSNPEKRSQLPQDPNETPQSQERQSADIPLNQNSTRPLSRPSEHRNVEYPRTRKKYDHVTGKRIAKARRVGACYICRKRKCDHVWGPEGQPTSISTFDKSQKTHTSTSSFLEVSFNLSLLNDTNKSAYSYSSTVRAKPGAAFESLSTYSPLEGYLFQEGKNNSASEWMLEKLNGYLPRDQGNEDLMVYMGGPRRKVEHENKPFYWKTGHEQTQPPRSRTVPRVEVQTEHAGTSTQTARPPPIRQMQQNSSSSHDQNLATHFQAPNPPIGQSGSLTAQNYESVATSSNQMFRRPLNRSRASHLPQPAYQAFDSTAPQYWEPATYPHTASNQQAYPTSTPTYYPIWSEDFRESSPSAVEGGQHSSSLATGLQALPTTEEPMSTAWSESPFSPTFQHDAVGVSSQQDNWIDQDTLPFDSSTQTPDDYEDETQYGYHAAGFPTQNNSLYPDFQSTESGYTRRLSMQAGSPFDQPSAQDDGMSTGPGPSLGYSSAVTISSPFDTSSYQSAPYPTINRTSASVNRPAYSLPQSDLNGLTAASPKGDWEAPPDGCLSEWLLDDEEQ